LENQIQILKKGVEYLVDTTNRAAKETLYIRFCHKDATTSLFINGVTSEGLMQVLIDRYNTLVQKDNSPQNVQTLLFLRHAYDSVKSRKALKRLVNDDHKTTGVAVQTEG
jgi:hypothetical protein